MTKSISTCTLRRCVGLAAVVLLNGVSGFCLTAAEQPDVVKEKDGVVAIEAEATASDLGKWQKKT